MKKIVFGTRWMGRAAVYLLAPCAVLIATATLVMATPPNTSWIKPGNPISSVALTAALQTLDDPIAMRAAGVPSNSVSAWSGSGPPVETGPLVFPAPPAVGTAWGFDGTAGAYNSTTGVFTAPVEGSYHIHAMLWLEQCTLSANQGASLIVTINGVDGGTSAPGLGYFATYRSQANIDLDVTLAGDDLVRLSASDTLSIHLEHSCTSLAGIKPFSTFSIYRVGK